MAEDVTDLYREFGDSRVPPGQRATDEFPVLSKGFHCVTGWSALDCEFTGVPFATLAERAGVHDDAVHVLFHALDGYTTDLPLSECLHEGVLFVYGHDGDTLATDHGGPLRVVTPHKYAYKGAKWVDGVEFLTERKPATPRARTPGTRSGTGRWQYNRPRPLHTRATVFNSLSTGERPTASERSERPQQKVGGIVK